MIQLILEIYGKKIDQLYCFSSMQNHYFLGFFLLGK